jgi:hypothetical protein
VRTAIGTCRATAMADAEAPRSLPVVPCPIYDGHPIQWQPWTAQPRMTHINPRCESCAFPGPLSGSFGTALPLPGETFDSWRLAKTRHGRLDYYRPTKEPAWPVHRLFAVLCPSCFRLDVHETGRDGQSAQVILCDGCDVPCAVGANLDEARHALITVCGGWTGTGADWDLCAACNPAEVPNPTPRALAAIAAAGYHLREG